jgi:hypothetical protein
MSVHVSTAPALTDALVAPAPRRRRAGGLRPLAIVAVVLLLVAVLGHAIGGSEPGGPASSSYSTGASGVAAWATLLARTGRTVLQVRTPLQTAPLPPSETVVLLAPDALLRDEGVRLMDFVRAGGTLVFGGGDPNTALPALLPAGPAWSSSAARSFTASRGALTGVGAVSTAGEGAWRQTAGYVPLLQDGAGRALLLERRLGRGRLLLLADDSPLQNRLLAEADNAQLAVDLAGAPGRPVAFVESVHGYGESRGLAALPQGWIVAFVGLALAGALWVAARGRRLGPPEPAAEPLAPPRSEYAEALGRLLRRTGDSQEIAKKLDEMRRRP